MKKIFIALFIFISPFTISFAQQLINRSKEEMRKLSVLVGKWEGEASTIRGNGEKSTLQMSENIQWRMDTLLLLFEGVGKIKQASGPSTKAFEAVSIISYDKDSGNYKFRVYLEDGRNAEVNFLPLAPSHYQWQFKTLSGWMRYEIKIDTASHHWNEKGYYSKDGLKWTPFFEMNLTKQNAIK